MCSIYVPSPHHTSLIVCVNSFWTNWMPLDDDIHSVSSVRVSVSPMSRPYGDHSHSRHSALTPGTGRGVSTGSWSPGDWSHVSRDTRALTRHTRGHAEDGGCRHLINGFLYQVSFIIMHQNHQLNLGNDFTIGNHLANWLLLDQGENDIL